MLTAYASTPLFPSYPSAEYVLRVKEGASSQRAKEAALGQQEVAGYFRVSVARDGMRAPEMYRDEIQRYCLYRELKLAAIFDDIDYSGFRGARPRPGLQELTDRRFEFSSIIVPKLSRFGRSVKDLVNLFDMFDADGIALVFLDMNINTATSQGRLLRHIMAAFAEYESDVKSDYARANHRLVRAHGQPWGGRPPFGYERHPTERSYVINEKRAEIVRVAFNRYLQGSSQYQIARELNERHLVRPSGKPWSCQQVGRVLDNPAYAALCIVDDELIPAVWEPIVERSSWEKVRKLRVNDKRRYRQLRVAKGGPYLLSGLFYCGLCGRKLHHRSRAKSANGVYACVLPGGRRCPGGSVDASLAEDFVSQRFIETCQFSIEQSHGLTFGENARRWDAASLLDRRKLLSLTVRRVVLVPWPGGERPRRVAGRRRDLEIEWVRGATNPTALLAAPETEPEPRPRVSEGRVEMMRALEVEKAARRREERSQRVKDYYAGWRKARGLTP